MTLFQPIQKVLDLIDFQSITEQRQNELQELIDYLIDCNQNDHAIRLNFICTHNSRRSQFAQVWAAVASSIYRIPIDSCSGGVEVTACNERTIASLVRFGFRISAAEGENPIYSVHFSEKSSIKLFSKLYDDKINPKDGFAAIMTCSHADENCPVVRGCVKRIALRYDDPKLYDDSPLESSMYDYRSLQIATEMMYVFSKISKK